MLINGSPQTKLDLSDRAISYGDGLFETIRLHQGQPVFLQQHLQRLAHGCERLGIDCQMQLLKKDIGVLADQFSAYGVLKIIISRGSAGRGYRPATASLPPTRQEATTSPSSTNASTRILTLHALPDYTQALSSGGIKAFICRQRLGYQPSFAGLKHLNRLEQVMASREWPSNDYLEGVMLDLEGNVIEGTKSNIFYAKDGKLFTPDLSRCGVNGVMRQILLEGFGSELKIERCALASLLDADEVFVCNSVFGIWPLLSIETEGNEAHYSPAEFCRRAQEFFSNGMEG